MRMGFLWQFFCLGVLWTCFSAGMDAKHTFDIAFFAISMTKMFCFCVLVDNPALLGYYYFVGNHQLWQLAAEFGGKLNESSYF